MLYSGLRKGRPSFPFLGDFIVKDNIVPGATPSESQGALTTFLQQAREAAAKIVQEIRDISNSHHSAPLHAFIRQGAKELSQALVALPDSNIRPIEEPGQIFNNTMQEVFLNKTGRELDVDMGR
jgi:hypothetical protein